MTNHIAQIARARDMARLVGWKECRRASITVEHGQASLRIRYLMPPLHQVRPGDPEDGVSLDMRDMPKGVSVMMAEAPPDDVIDLPADLTDQQVREVASAIGRSNITKGDRSDGATIYWMDS